MRFEQPQSEAEKKGENSGGDAKRAEMREVLTMESALRTIQADYAKRVPRGGMPERIEKIMDALHTKMAESPDALESMKQDYKILEGQFTGAMAPARFQSPAQKEAFGKIGAELEKVRVRGM